MATLRPVGDASVWTRLDQLASMDAIVWRFLCRKIGHENVAPFGTLVPTGVNGVRRNGSVAFRPGIVTTRGTLPKHDEAFKSCCPQIVASCVALRLQLALLSSVLRKQWAAVAQSCSRTFGLLEGPGRFGENRVTPARTNLPQAENP